MASDKCIALRAEQRKRKQNSRSEPKGKRFKNGNVRQNRESDENVDVVNVTVPTDFDLHIVKKEEPYDEAEYGAPYQNYDGSTGDFGAIYDTSQIDDDYNYDCGPPLDYDLDSRSDCERVLDFGYSDNEIASGEDWTRPPEHVIKQEPPDSPISSFPEPDYFGAYYQEGNPSPAANRHDAISPFMERDDLDAMLEMEEQLATMHVVKSEPDDVSYDDVNNEIRQESDHAAFNLERELNG
ncbi:hypothetical protein COOONC_08956 [Cooperia oncophora]